ncbi:hypothetical protein AOLI_G00122950 [Acnodon oligacanthus]
MAACRRSDIHPVTSSRSVHKYVTVVRREKNRSSFKSRHMDIFPSLNAIPTVCYSAYCFSRQKILERDNLFDCRGFGIDYRGLSWTILQAHNSLHSFGLKMAWKQFTFSGHCVN